MDFNEDLKDWLFFELLNMKWDSKGILQLSVEYLHLHVEISFMRFFKALFFFSFPSVEWKKICCFGYFYS